MFVLAQCLAITGLIKSLNVYVELHGVASYDNYHVLL